MNTLYDLWPASPANHRLWRAVDSLRPEQKPLLFAFLSPDAISKYVYLADMVDLLRAGPKPFSDPSTRKEYHTTLLKRFQNHFIPDLEGTMHRVTPKDSMKGSYKITCVDGTQVRLIHPINHIYNISGVCSVAEFLS